MADHRRPSPALDIRVPATPASLRARLDGLLDDHDPFAIEEDDIDDDGPGDDGTDPPTARTRRVHFYSAQARDDAARAIRAALGPDGVRAAATDVPDPGWAERTQRALRAIEVDDLIIAPPWDRPGAGTAAERVIVIEPSMGFGTGHHATTRLCLRALQHHRAAVARSTHVLDVGTGSGVLAIAAVRLGAPAVTAVDCDPDALANARDNVARNEVTTSVTFIHEDLATFDTSRAEVIVANLTASVLERYGAALIRLLSPDGLLVVSGFTGDQEPAVRAALTPLTSVDHLAEEDWCALVCRARAPHR